MRGGHSRHLVFGANENVYAGAAVTVKEQRTFLMLREERGQTVLTAEEIGGGKLAEVNFFVVNPTTLRGVFTKYWGACSLSVLEWRLRSVVREFRRDVEDDHSRMMLKLQPLHRKEDIPTLIRELNEVGSITFDFAALGPSNKLFEPLADQARVTQTTIRFVQGAKAHQLVQPIMDVLKNANPASAHIRGERQDGFEDVVHLVENATTFGTFEYDDIMGLGDIDLDAILDSEQLVFVADVYSEHEEFFATEEK